jgi:chromosome segregation ATPase
MNNVHLIKSKVEKLQKENLELIYLKDQQAKLYENEKLNFMIFQRREQDYKMEIENLHFRVNKYERENETLREFLDKKNQEESKIKFSPKNFETNGKNLNFEKNENFNHSDEEINLLLSQKNNFQEKLEEEMRKNLENSQLINNLTQTNEQYKQNISELKNTKNSLEEKNFQLIQENKLINDNMNKFSLRYYNYDQQMNMKIKEIEYLNEQLIYTSDKMNSLEKKYENLNIQFENKNNIIDDLTARIKSLNNCTCNPGNSLEYGMKNQMDNENGFQSENILQKNKINQLTEQNNFLSVRLNNITSTNNHLMKEKENLFLEIQKIKSGQGSDCVGDCKNKIFELEENLKIFKNYENLKNSHEILKNEIESLTQEKNSILIENEKLKSEMKNFENFQTNNFNILTNFQNENLNLKNVIKHRGESYNELLEKFNKINKHLQEKENLIKFLENENFNLKNEIYEINNKLFKKEQEISLLQKELIILNKDIVEGKIQSGEIKEKIIENDFINKNLNSQIKENTLTSYNLEAMNEKLKMILNNKDEIISKQGGEISNLLIKLKDNEQKFISVENDFRKLNEKILYLEAEKKNMNKLLIKYKLNNGK